MCYIWLQVMVKYPSLDFLQLLFGLNKLILVQPPKHHRNLMCGSSRRTEGPALTHIIIVSKR